jgi:hypothetical protein
MDYVRRAAASALTLCALVLAGPAAGRDKAPIAQGARYVAMGSSFASGSGIAPYDPGAPARCQRSTENYAHQFARKHRLALVDVTCGGATTAHIPDDTESMDLDLGGVSAAASLTAGQPLQITNISLGEHTTTLSRNGVRAIAIDLNPDDGRALDAKVTRDDAAGTTTVAFSPRLDLHVAVDHAVLGDTAKLFDVTGIRIEGSMSGRDDSEQIRIAGALAITTNPASYGVTATAGQCVTTADATDPTTGAPYTQWTVGACL